MSVKVSRPLFRLEVKDDYPLVRALLDEHMRADRVMVPVEGEPDMFTFAPGTFSPDYTPMSGAGRCIHYYDMEFMDGVLAFVEAHKTRGDVVVEQ